MKALRAHGPALLVLILGLGVFFLPALLPNATFFARDTLRMHGPIREYAQERLLSGELPLWWSYEALGTPFLAQAVTSVLHPLALLSLPFSTPNAIRFVTLASFLLGALGMYALSRRLSLSAFSSAFTGLAYSLSGYTVSMSDNWFYLAGATTLPWFLFAVEGLRTKGRHFALLALVLASVLLLGEFQAAYVMSAVGLFWGMFRAPQGQRMRFVGTYGLGIVAAALVASVQLAASWELLGHTARGEGLKLEETMRWSLHPFRLFEFFFGRVLPEQGGSFEYSRLLMGEGLAGNWANLVYVGVGVLTLALCAFFGGRRLADASVRKHVWFLGAWAAFSLLMALGKYGGLYEGALNWAPLWSAFRFPEKLLPYAVLPLVLLAGLALEHCHALPIFRWLLGMTLLSFSVSATLWAFPDTLATWMLRVDEMKGPGNDLLRLEAARDMLRTAFASSWQASLTLLLLTLAVLLLLKRKPAWVPGGLALVSVGQLALASHSAFDVTHKPLYAFEPALVKPLSENVRYGRYRFITLTGPRPRRLHREEGFTPTENLSLYDKNTLSPDFNVSWRLDNLNPYLPGALENLAELRRKSGNWARIGSLFSTRYLVVSSSDWAAAPKTTAAEVLAEVPKWNLSLIDTHDAVPRSYLACAEKVESRSDGIRRLVNDAFPRGQHVVVVKTDDAEGTLPACDSTQPVSGSSEILDYAQEKVRIRTEAATDAVLVLNDAFYPGWEARLDGANVPILQVNLAVRGVRVPSGSHEVVFEYRPRWLLLSSWVSCLTALGLVISLFVNRPRQVRQGAA